MHSLLQVSYFHCSIENHEGGGKIGLEGFCAQGTSDCDPLPDGSACGAVDRFKQDSGQYELAGLCNIVDAHHGAEFRKTVVSQEVMQFLDLVQGNELDIGFLGRVVVRTAHDFSSSRPEHRSHITVAENRIVVFRHVLFLLLLMLSFTTARKLALSMQKQRISCDS